MVTPLGPALGTLQVTVAQLPQAFPWSLKALPVLPVFPVPPPPHPPLSAVVSHSRPPRRGLCPALRMQRAANSPDGCRWGSGGPPAAATTGARPPGASSRPGTTLLDLGPLTRAEHGFYFLTCARVMTEGRRRRGGTRAQEGFLFTLDTDPGVACPQ